MQVRKYGIQTRRCFCVTHLQGDRRLVLSGTIMQNKFSDLGSICAFLGLREESTASWWERATKEALAEWRRLYYLRRTKVRRLNYATML